MSLAGVFIAPDSLGHCALVCGYGYVGSGCGTPSVLWCCVSLPCDTTGSGV